MKKKTRVKVLKLSGGMMVKGAIKNGLDTSRLVNMVVCFDSPKDFKIKGFSSPPNLFFIHEVTFSETLGILINEFKFDKKAAIAKIREWKSKLNISEIKRDKDSEKYEEIVEKMNEEIVKEKGEGYEIGESDIAIIAGFKQNGVNIVHAKDKGFEETCKRLEIEIMSTPKRDFEKEKEIKRKLTKRL